VVWKPQRNMDGEAAVALLSRGALEATRLARENSHPRDARVTFEEASHVYSVDGVPLDVSVTGVLKEVEREPFDAEAVAAKLAARPTASYNAGVDPATGAWLPLAAPDILKSWDANRDLGTHLHGCLERHLNGLPTAPEAVADEFGQGLRWLATCGMTPFRTEWVIFDEVAGVAGSVDFVGKHPDGTLGIVDWKRCKHGDRSFFAHWKGANMLPPLDHLPECKLSHWHAQVNLYRIMLERRYDVRVSTMCMVVMMPGQPEAVEYVHRRDDAVAALLDRRCAAPTVAAAAAVCAGTE